MATATNVGRYRKAMRILDHAIESLGETKPCGLLIYDGATTYLLPHRQTPRDHARLILARAMCQVVAERNEAV